MGKRKERKLLASRPEVGGVSGEWRRDEAGDVGELMLVGDEERWRTGEAGEFRDDSRGREGESSSIRGENDGNGHGPS